MMVVQIVEILWTKATRGAPRAAERVALPRAFSIEEVSGHYVVQRHRILEWEGFSVQTLPSRAESKVPDCEDVLRIAAEPDGVYRLGLTGAPSGGKPSRHPRLGVVRLAANQFARLSVNARHAHYSGQWYSETVFNVACGSSVPPNRFLVHAPDHVFELKADLF